MMFNNNNWKLSVTDINLYENTVSLDGQPYPLSLAIKTLIPGYLSGLPSTSREAMELLEALAEAGVAKELASQKERMREENMTDAEWQKELQRREQVKAERRTYGENLRSATHSAGRSRAAIVADLESGGNWLDSL